MSKRLQADLERINGGGKSPAPRDRWDEMLDEVNAADFIGHLDEVCRGILAVPRHVAVRALGRLADAIGVAAEDRMALELCLSVAREKAKQEAEEDGERWDGLG